MNLAEQQLLIAIKKLRPKIQLQANGNKSLTIQFYNGSLLNIPLVNNQQISSSSRSRY